MYTTIIYLVLVGVNFDGSQLPRDKHPMVDIKSCVAAGTEIVLKTMQKHDGIRAAAFSCVVERAPKA